MKDNLTDIQNLNGTPKPESVIPDLKTSVQLYIERCLRLTGKTRQGYLHTALCFSSVCLIYMQISEFCTYTECHMNYDFAFFAYDFFS